MHFTSTAKKGDNAAARPLITHRETLHFAMDAEFLKGNGAIFARSVAFVPFFLANAVEVNGRSVQEPAGASSPSALALGGGPAMRPRGAAAQALLQAKLRKEMAVEEHAAATNSQALAAFGPSPAAASPLTDSPGSVVVVATISPRAFTPRTVVVAMRHSAVLPASDLLPCGHSIDPVVMRRMPRSYYTGVLPYAPSTSKNSPFRALPAPSASFGLPSNSSASKGGTASGSPLNSGTSGTARSRAIPAAPKLHGGSPHSEEQGAAPVEASASGIMMSANLGGNSKEDNSSRRHHERLMARLDPYNIPCYATLGPLLTELYAAAERERQSEAAAEAYARKGGQEEGRESSPMMVTFRGGGSARGGQPSPYSASRRLADWLDTADDRADYGDHIGTRGGSVDKTARVLAAFAARLHRPSSSDKAAGAAQFGVNAHPPPSFAEVLAVAEAVLRPVMTTTTSPSKRPSLMKGRSFLRDAKLYGPPFLFNYFPNGEEEFVAFLEDCSEAVAKSLASTEPRYTNAVGMRVPWGLLTGSAAIAAGASPCGKALPSIAVGQSADERVAEADAACAGIDSAAGNDAEANSAAVLVQQKSSEKEPSGVVTPLIDGRIAEWSAAATAPDSPPTNLSETSQASPFSPLPPLPPLPSLPHHYILCDSLEEFAVATSAVWRRLMEVGESVEAGPLHVPTAAASNPFPANSKDANAPSAGSQKPLSALFGDAFGSGAKGSPSSSSSSSGAGSLFYSYGPGDAPVVRATAALVREMPRVQVDAIVEKLRLSEALDVIYPLRRSAAEEQRGGNPQNKAGTIVAAGTASTPSAAEEEAPHPLLLRSPFLVAVRDITAHSLFVASGIPHAGRKVPKLIDSLRLVAPQSAEARALLRASGTDNHNPLWDAAALAAICTFVLRMRR